MVSIYEDLMATRGGGGPLDKLVPVPVGKVRRIKEAFGAVPEDFIRFLEDVGAGELGTAAYMLYDGLVKPEEIYGEGSGIVGVLLFGDDFQGFNSGFDIASWNVVEIDPVIMQIGVVAPNFQSFIRSRIRALG